MNIYLDQNYLIDFGTGKSPDDFKLELDIQDKIITEQKHRFVVSAWNMYELSKAEDAAERRSIIDFVGRLNPLYFNNNNFIKSQELQVFLERRGLLPFRAGVVKPLSDSLAGMWATY